MMNEFLSYLGIVKSNNNKKNNRSSEERGFVAALSLPFPIGPRLNGL